MWQGREGRGPRVKWTNEKIGLTDGKEGQPSLSNGASANASVLASSYLYVVQVMVLANDIGYVMDLADKESTKPNIYLLKGNTIHP